MKINNINIKFMGTCTHTYSIALTCLNGKPYRLIHGQIGLGIIITICPFFNAFHKEISKEFIACSNDINNFFSLFLIIVISSSSISLICVCISSINDMMDCLRRWDFKRFSACVLSLFIVAFFFPVNTILTHDVSF